MRRALMAVAGVVALGFVAANLNISQPQAITDGVLTDLKLEPQPNTTGLVGGPSKFKVTQKTIDYLTKLHTDGKVIVVGSNGSIHIE